jgi:elongator complex protein 3 (tRNA carboxymethyluridine synthase)
MSMPEDYRNNFIAQLHNSLSGFTGSDVDEAVRFEFFPSYSVIRDLSLEIFLIRYSEQGKSKAIGITIETRPDYCLRPHLRSFHWIGSSQVCQIDLCCP